MRRPARCSRPSRGRRPEYCIVWGNTLSDDGSVSDANTVGGKGLKAPWMKTAKDLVGRRRIIGGKVDIGCYETDFTYGLLLIFR